MYIGNFKVFVHRYSSGDIYLSKAQVYVFQSDGRIFQFSLDNDDGTLEGDDKDIWNVCDIDGVTGNVVATDKSRHVLDFKGGYVEVCCLRFFSLSRALFLSFSLSLSLSLPLSLVFQKKSNKNRKKKTNRCAGVLCLFILVHAQGQHLSV
jgi:hypothetical protein